MQENVGNVDKLMRVNGPSAPLIYYNLGERPSQAWHVRVLIRYDVILCFDITFMITPLTDSNPKEGLVLL